MAPPSCAPPPPMASDTARKSRFAFSDKDRRLTVSFGSSGSGGVAAMGCRFALRQRRPATFPLQVQSERYSRPRCWPSPRGECRQRRPRTRGVHNRFGLGRAPSHTEAVLEPSLLWAARPGAIGSYALRYHRSARWPAARFRTGRPCHRAPGSQSVHPGGEPCMPPTSAARGADPHGPCLPRNCQTFDELPPLCDRHRHPGASAPWNHILLGASNDRHSDAGHQPGQPNRALYNEQGKPNNRSPPGRGLAHCSARFQSHVNLIAYNPNRRGKISSAPAAACGGLQSALELFAMLA